MLAGITCDHETEMLILTMYLKKVLESFKYFTNVFDPVSGKDKSSLVQSSKCLELIRVTVPTKA